MRRVLIIGNAGSGKSTFAKKLAKTTGLSLVHLDKIYWRGNWEHLTREEFDKALQAELEKEEWIIDGNFSRTLPRRLEYCDTVIWLDLPVGVEQCTVRLPGAEDRILTGHGKFELNI